MKIYLVIDKDIRLKHITNNYDDARWYVAINEIKMNIEDDCIWEVIEWSKAALNHDLVNFIRELDKIYLVFNDNKQIIFLTSTLDKANYFNKLRVPKEYRNSFNNIIEMNKENIDKLLQLL